MSNVVHKDFDGKLSAPTMLRRLADDEDLVGVVTICKWKGDGMTTGWSNMNYGEIALMILELQQELINRP